LPIAPGRPYPRTLYQIIGEIQVNMSLEKWSYIAAIVGALVALFGFPLLS
jgi:hypothetical protein